MAMPGLLTDAIRNNWGGWPLEDRGAWRSPPPTIRSLMPTMLALGASYGGYMMNWTEGSGPIASSASSA
jgi:hypothetical protein